MKCKGTAKKEVPCDEEAVDGDFCHAHQMSLESEYKHTCHDALEWAEIDQLHAATIEISKNCFEYKKLCVGLLGVGIALIIKLSATLFSHTLFMIAILICIGFWTADATAYYYQKSVRSSMYSKMNLIAQRNKITDFTRDASSISWDKAFINGSMSLYAAIAGMTLFGWLIYGIAGQ